MRPISILDRLPPPFTTVLCFRIWTEESSGICRQERVLAQRGKSVLKRARDAAAHSIWSGMDGCSWSDTTVEAWMPLNADEIWELVQLSKGPINE